MNDPQAVQPSTGAGRRGLDQALASTHAVAACAWVVSIGISTAAESVTFGVLAALSVIRWREVAKRIADPAVRVPLLLCLFLLGWMLLGCTWGGDGLRLRDRLPHRTFLGTALLIGASVPSRWLMTSLAAAGAWWTAVLIASRVELAPAAAFLPKHISQTFLGFDGLAAVGLGLAASGSGFGPRALGMTALSVAMLGASLAASRGHVLAIGLAAPCCFAIAAILRGQWRQLAVVALAFAVAAAMFVPRLPVWDKARAGIAQSGISVDRRPTFGSLYRAADPWRADLHLWTVTHIPEHPLRGHGAGTWTRDFQASMASGIGALDWDAPHRATISPIDSAHSIFLETTYELGAIGLIAMVAIPASLAGRLLRTGADASRMAMFAILIITAVAGLGDLELNSRSSAARLAFAMALAAVPAQRAREQRGHSNSEA